MMQPCNQPSRKSSKSNESRYRQGKDSMNQPNVAMKHKDITEKIIGCGMKVHGTLGNGFQEVIYQRAMAIEMPFQGLTFEREKEMDIFYRGEK